MASITATAERFKSEGARVVTSRAAESPEQCGQTNTCGHCIAPMPGVVKHPTMQHPYHPRLRRMKLVL
jgi:hypothetical protein